MPLPAAAPGRLRAAGTRGARAVLWSVLLGGLLLACDREERVARSHLEGQGIRDLVLRSTGAEGAFSYTGRRAEQRCLGEITVQRRRHETTIDDRQVCRADEQACAAGRARACHELGRMHDVGDDDPIDPTPKDPVVAAAYYDKGCRAGHGGSCNVLGLRQAEGFGRPRSAPKANLSFARSCQLEHGRGCYNLALHTAGGIGVVADQARAATLYDMACRLRVPAACYNLGVARRDGVGVEASPAEAARRFDQACMLDYEQGCVNLGVMLTLGEDVEPDHARAASLFRKACDLGLPAGCQGLKKLDGALDL